MTTRFLSFVALAGMLVAAGCSGGGGAGSTLGGGLTPSTGTGGGATGGSSAGTGAITSSFLIPTAGVPTGTASSSRSPKYVSPSSYGITVLLGNGTTSTTGGASGNAALFQAFGTGAGNSQWSTTLGQSVLQLIPGSFNATPVVGQAVTFTNLSGTAVGLAGAPATCAAGGTGVANASGTIYAAPNGTYGVCTGVAATGAALTFNITQVNGNGSVLNGTVTAGPLTGTLTAPTDQQNPNTTGTQTVPTANTLVAFVGPSGTGQTPVIGTLTSPAQITAATQASPVCFAIPTSVYGANPGPSTACYYFTASAKAGYTQVTLTLSNLLAQANYDVGVILTDKAGFVLSEQQAAGIVVAASGQVVVPMTLLPVVYGMIAAPPVQDLLTTVGGGVQPGSYETTLFLTDKDNNVIPLTAPAAAAADNAPTAGGSTLWSVTSGVAGSLTFNYWLNAAASGQAAITNTSLTALPAGGFTGSVATVTAGGAFGTITNGNVFGWFLPNLPVPTTFGLPTPISATAAVAATLATAGVPLNLSCNPGVAGIAATTFTYTLTSAVNGTVVGFTPVAGTNYPSAAPTGTLGSVNCVPGIINTIN